MDRLKYVPEPILDFILSFLSYKDVCQLGATNLYYHRLCCSDQFKLRYAKQRYHSIVREKRKYLDLRHFTYNDVIKILGSRQIGVCISSDHETYLRIEKISRSELRGIISAYETLKRIPPDESTFRHYIKPDNLSMTVILPTGKFDFHKYATKDLYPTPKGSTYRACIAPLGYDIIIHKEQLYNVDKEVMKGYRNVITCFNFRVDFWHW